MIAHMGEAFLQMLPFAVAIALSPVAVIAMVLILGTKHAKANGFSFFTGWIGGVYVIGMLILRVLSSREIRRFERAFSSEILMFFFIVGLLCLIISFKQWMDRPKKEEAVVMPKWLSVVHTIRSPAAAVLGIILGSVSPKNFLLIVGGAKVISETEILRSAQAFSWISFTVVASLGVAVPFFVYLSGGERSVVILQQLKVWLARNNNSITAFLLLIIGIRLIAEVLIEFLL